MPYEFTQVDRRELDDAVFELLGVSRSRRQSLVDRLYEETAIHFRWIRVGEIQKIEQRRKSTSRKFSTEELAADLWDAAELEDLTPLAEWIAKQPGVTTAAIIPDGSPHLSAHAKMFDDATVYFGKDRKEHIVCRSREEAELIKSLAEFGVHGTIHVPEKPADCKKLNASVEARIRAAMDRFRELAQTRTSIEEKQQEVIDLLLRWFILGRPGQASPGQINTVPEVGQPSANRFP